MRPWSFLLCYHSIIYIPLRYVINSSMYISINNRHIQHIKKYEQITIHINDHSNTNMTFWSLPYTEALHHAAQEETPRALQRGAGVGAQSAAEPRRGQAVGGGLATEITGKGGENPWKLLEIAGNMWEDLVGKCGKRRKNSGKWWMSGVFLTCVF